MCIDIEGGEVEARLRLQEKTIYHLKQEMAFLKEEKKSMPLVPTEEGSAANNMCNISV